jgi:DNA repair protein SbcC/Rad50
MRIRKIVFCNINSLRGRFEIDFCDPELSGHGIFAITGQTGSGKTTILDAVSLALFGRTPRLTIAASGNELMARGTGSCFSEIEFEASFEGRLVEFRSRWEQKRAREKADGKLQNPKMKLVQLSEKMRSDEFETEKLSEVPKKIEMITGLDYGRFTRTCMLAQGQFAAFLEASESDRAEILEQITGTEIYSKLSTAAYDADKDKRAEISQLEQNLSGISLLDAAGFEALEAEISEVKTRMEAVQKEKESIQGEIIRLKSLASLQNARLTLNSQKLELEADYKSHDEDFKKLAQARKAEPARVQLANIEGLKSLERLKGDEFRALEEQTPLIEKQLVNAESDLVASRDKLAEFIRAAESARALIGRARIVDQKLHGLGKVKNDHASSRDNVLKRVSEAEGRLKKLETQREKVVRERSEIESFLNGSRIDSCLGADLKAIENDFSGFRNTQKSVLTAVEAVKNSEIVVSESLAGLKKIGDRLNKAVEAESARKSDLEKAAKVLVEKFNGESVKTFQARTGILQNRVNDSLALSSLGEEMHQESESLKTNLDKMNRHSAEIASLETAVSGLEKEVEAVDLRIEQLHESEVRLRTVASFDEHRGQLKDGAPCPLCGAVEHPFAAGTDTASALGDLEQELSRVRGSRKAIDKSLRSGRKSLEKARGDFASEERAVAELTRSLSLKEKKWKKLRDRLQIELTFENREEVADVAASAAAGLKCEESAFDAFQAASTALEKSEKKLSKAREDRQNLDREAAECRGVIETNKAVHHNNMTRLAELENDLTEQSEKLRGSVICYGYSEFDEEVVKALRQRWSLWQESEAKQNKLAERERDFQEKIAGAVSELNAGRHQLEDADRAFCISSEAFEACRQERQELFGERIPDDEEASLAKQDKKIREVESLASARLQRLKVELAGHQANHVSLKNELQRVSGEIGEASRQLSELSLHQGFPDLSSLKGALLEIKELNRLAELEQELANRGSGIKGSIEAVEKQISELEAGKTAGLSLDDLRLGEAALAKEIESLLAVWQEKSALYCHI